MDNLVNIIEAILFVAGDGVQYFDIADKLEISEKEVKNAVEELKQRYESFNSGIKVVTYNNKAQLSTNQDYINEVTVVLNPIKEKQLTKAVLEVLAIIAYKQPVTRLDVENVRGVNCDYAISTLLDNNIIEVVGRKDAVGKPLLFGTTDLFLKRFNLNSIDDLPDYEELLNRIKVIETPKDNSLFNYGEHVVEDNGTNENNSESENANESNEEEQIKIYNEINDKINEASSNLDEIFDEDEFEEDYDDDDDDNDDEEDLI